MAERYGACKSCSGAGKRPGLTQTEILEESSACRCKGCKRRLEELKASPDGIRVIKPEDVGLEETDPEHWRVWVETKTTKTTTRFLECLACGGTGHSGDASERGGI